MEDIELGTLLKKARQEKELTLDDIQERTKIRKKYLEAIEANDFDILPGKVYLKVFVKGYAREVDINYKELLNYYPVLNIKEEKTNTLHKDFLDGTKVSHKVKRNKNSKKSIFKIIFIVIAALFLIAAAVYSFQYFRDSEIRLLNQNNKEEQQIINQGSEIVETETGSTEANNQQNAVNDQKDTLNSINVDFLSNQSTNQNLETINQNDFNNTAEFNDLNADEINEIIESEAAEEENITAETSIDLSADSDLKEAEINQEAVKSEVNNDSVESESEINNDAQSTAENISNTETNTEVKTEEVSQLTEADRDIVFRASNTVWVNVRVDGETAFSGILEAGDSREFEIENKLYIKIGNASAVTAVVNGEERGPWGGTGGIAELEFTAADNRIQINNLRE
ncbi:helix-turn-helix domain-containing protein [Halanaerobium congolense]|uniref:Cytoskeletal protein RodZ n=1 Tax=Halanaerobium congolense TaxID=54121 RepID=A0A318ECN6_9FIRM|nr:helix-turn-helix domain-containing protein [Halanaerobium congolense]PXV69364.1 cytoskeletal protein RodZ [Halanaerobium congolense]TDS33726.1 cytoskeletal protein RodZ [Halanaerobium congolense]